MSIRKQSISAFFWASSQQVLALILNLSVSIWLARILTPFEFGLIGMMTIFITFGTLLMNSGMNVSLIRTNNANESDYSSVFYSNLIIAVFVYVLFYLFSPLISNFFKTPELTILVKIYSLIVLIKATSSIHLVFLSKKLDFKKTFRARFPALIIGGITGIIMAYLNFGVWSIITMYLIQECVNSLILWFSSGWKPQLIFSLKKVKYHFGFGIKISISVILNSFYANLYNVLIGKFYNPNILGFYTRSQSLVGLLVSNLQEVIDKVSYPMLSTVQRDDSQVKAIYQRIFKILNIIIQPILILGIILAEPLFRFVLTDKWLPAVPYFQLLCIVGIFNPLVHTNLNVIKLKGKGQLYLKLNLVQKFLTTVGLFIVFPFGVIGFIGLQIFIEIISFLLNSWFSGNLIKYQLKFQLSDFGKILMITLSSGLFTWIFKELVEVWIDNDSVVILLSMIFYGGIYLFGLNRYSKNEIDVIKGVFIELINRK